MRAILPLAALFMATLTAAAFPNLQGLDEAALSVVNEVRLPVGNGRRDDTDFGAKADTATTQCQQSLQTAGAAALLLCPYVQTYANGGMDSTTFLAKFCNDGCATLAYTALYPFLSCVDSNSAAIYQATQECAKRPQCYKGTKLAALKDFNSCFNPLLNSTDFSDAGQTSVTTTCAASSNCQTKIATFVSQNSDCLPASASTVTVATAVGFYNFLCSTPAGMSDTCAWNLRSIGRLTCSNSGSCSKGNNWCSSSGSSCSANLTKARLDTLCSPCLSGLKTYAAYMGGDPLQVAALESVYCAKVDPTSNSSGYCWNTVSLANVLLFPTTTDGVAQACSDKSGRCLPRMINAFADITSTSAASTFKTCAAYPASYFSFVTTCQLPYENDLRSAESLRRTGALACARNVNGTLCFPLAWNARNDQCFFAGQNGLCPSGCMASVATSVATVGCCLPIINSYLQLQSQGFAANYLPAGTQTVQGFNSTISFTHTSLYAYADVIDRSLQPANALAVCKNSTDLWNAVETSCPASSAAVQRKLSIAIAWSNLIKNNATFQKVKRGLRVDIANLMSLSSDLIRSDDIFENPSLSVKLSSSRARRAAAGGGTGNTGGSTSSGVTYVFYVDAGSDSASAASNFDTRLSAGTLTLTTTASVLVSSCQTCLASGTDLSNPLAAINAGVNTATTLAPGLTATPPTAAPVYATLPSSSATWTSAVLAAAVAVVAMFVY